MGFELIKSEVVLRARVFLLRRDWLKTPDGRETAYDIIEHHGSVAIVPVDADGNILFVRQYRHAAGKDVLELPAGTLEPNEDPEVCAAREIREETGFAAGRLEKIGAFYLAPGYSTEFMTVYLARDLKHAPLKADDDEFLSVESVPAAEAIRMAERGEIPDAKSLAALLLVQSHLK